MSEAKWDEYQGEYDDDDSYDPYDSLEDWGA